MGARETPHSEELDPSITAATEEAYRQGKRVVEGLIARRGMPVRAKEPSRLIVEGDDHGEDTEEHPEIARGRRTGREAVRRLLRRE